MAPSPVIETTRLQLRPLSVGDLEALLVIEANSAYQTFIGGYANRDRARRGLENVVRDFASRGFGLFAVVQRDGAEILDVVGYCGLSPSDIDTGGDVQLLCAIRRGSWGRGLGYEACAAVLDWSFKDLGLPRVLGAVVAENAASLALVERLGMRRDCVRKNRDGVEEIIFVATPDSPSPPPQS